MAIRCRGLRRWHTPYQLLGSHRRERAAACSLPCGLPMGHLVSRSEAEPWTQWAACRALRCPPYLKSMKVWPVVAQQNWKARSAAVDQHRAGRVSSQVCLLSFQPWICSQPLSSSSSSRKLSTAKKPLGELQQWGSQHFRPYPIELFV